jgi:PAS domain S-box-containing protein
MLTAEISMDTLFNTLFRNTQDGIVIFDFSFRIIDMNPSMEVLSGYSKEEIAGRNVAEFVFKKDYEALLSQLHHAKDFGHGKVHLTHLFHKSGSTKIIEATEVVVPFNKENVILSMVRDVTEWHETRNALEKQKQFSEAILKSLPCIYYLIEIGDDFIPRLVKWNDHYQEESKITHEELLNKNILEFFNEEEQEVVKKEMGQMLSGEKQFFTNVFNPIMGDGTVERYYFQTVAYESEGKNCFLGTGINISDKRNLERILIESVIQTEESERRRISSDLHNGLGAELSTIKLYIQGFLDAGDKELQLGIGNKLLKLVDDAVDSISDISFNISPHVLLEYGLVAAVEAFVSKLRFNGKLKLSFKYDDFERFDLNEEVTLYRTITELINNTLKHACANRINMEIREKGRNLAVIYSDDGCGFDMGEVASSQVGMGLKNMKSRIESFDGSFAVNSSKGKGMKAKINLPISEQNG